MPVPSWLIEAGLNVIQSDKPLDKSLNEAAQKVSSEALTSIAVAQIRKALIGLQPEKRKELIAYILTDFCESCLHALTECNCKKARSITKRRKSGGSQ